MMYNVKNVHPSYANHPYTVIRDCYNEAAPNNGYWYWCSYDDIVLAQRAANDIGNGLIVESKDINPVYFNC